MKTVLFKTKDTDNEFIIEQAPNKKEILNCLDNHIENLAYDWFNGEDYAFYILYKDGSEDCIIGSDYDGHKVKKTNIESMVYSNASTNIVYGNYSINEYGVVQPSFQINVHENIEVAYNKENRVNKNIEQAV